LGWPLPDDLDDATLEQLLLENPVQGGTLFRNMPAGDSGGGKQVFVI